MDPQVVLDLLTSVDNGKLYFILGELLQSKPNIAPEIISNAIPELTYAPTKALSEKRCSGVISSVNMAGMSFINCPQLQTAFGCDVCVAPAQIAGFEKGEQVSFAVTLNEKSEPQAMDLQSLSPMDLENPGRKLNKVPPMLKAFRPLSTAGWPAFEPTEPADASPNETPQTQSLRLRPAGVPASIAGSSVAAIANNPAGVTCPSFPSYPPHTMRTGVTSQSEGQGVNMEDPGEILGQYFGVIKSYDALKGFGVICCKDLKDTFKTDVYVHGNACGNFGLSAEVKFEAYLFNGKLQGRNVQEGKVARGLPNEIGTFLGEVKVFHWDRGFGFITCDELRSQGYDGDAFVHHTEINGYWPGHLVAFTAYLNEGKLLARDLKDPAGVMLSSGRQAPTWDEAWAAAQETAASWACWKEPAKESNLVTDHMQRMQSLPHPKPKKVCLY